MTETHIRFATFFVAGLAIGGGATYLVTKSKLEKKYKDLADEEIASVKAMYERRDADVEQADEDGFVSEVTPEDIFDPREVVILTDEQVSEVLRTKPEVLTEEEVAEYNHTVSNYIPRDQQVAPIRNTKIPYLITGEEFMEDGIHEDEKITLTFYEECGTIADEDDDIMEPGNVAEFLGNENLKHFGENPDDPDVIHIRNERRGVDYELVRNNLSYAEVVLGVTNEDDWSDKDIKQKKRPRKMRNDE